MAERADQLGEWMTDHELFWTKLSAIGQLLGAAATFAAVAVSLWIVLSERSPKLKVKAGERLTIGGGLPEQRLLMISITNVGQRIAHIRTVGWRSGAWPWQRPKFLCRQYAVQMPGDTGLGRDPPFTIEPGEEISVYLNLDHYLARIRELDRDPMFSRAWPVLGLRRTRTWVWAGTADGMTARGPVEEPLIRLLVDAERNAQQRLLAAAEQTAAL
jgi:hypothetical protein